MKVAHENRARIVFIVVMLLASSTASHPLTVVTFGTSLTARGGWQHSLQRELSKCLGVSVDVRTVAMSGASSDWAIQNLEPVIAANPDVVLVEFAANDAAVDRFITPSHSRANLLRIIGSLRARNKAVAIYVVAMNPIFGLRGLMRPMLGYYLDQHAGVARTTGVGFIDLRPEWARLSFRELREAIPDGSHPLPSVTASIIVPKVVGVLSENRCSTQLDQSDNPPSKTE